jgi:hypothetical protein
VSTYGVKVTGVAGIRKALRPLLEPELSKELDAATKRGAQTYARALRPELRKVSRRMARAVRVKRAKKDRPGWVVGSRRKVAFFWPFVIGGTKDHGPRKADYLTFKGKDGQFLTTKRVRGVPANPIVDRVARAVEARAAADAERQFTNSTGL